MCRLHPKCRYTFDSICLMTQHSSQFLQQPRHAFKLEQRKYNELQWRGLWIHKKRNFSVLIYRISYQVAQLSEWKHTNRNRAYIGTCMYQPQNMYVHHSIYRGVGQPRLVELGHWQTVKWRRQMEPSTAHRKRMLVPACTCKNTLTYSVAVTIKYQLI